MPSVAEVLTDYRVKYVEAGEHHHAREGWAQMDCPFCGQDSGKYHLGVHLGRGYANCWKCGPHSLVEVLITVSGASSLRVRQSLRGLSLQRQETTWRTGELKPPRGIGDLQQPHRDYLKKRRFRAKTIADLWKIRGIGIASKLQWRLYIPIFQYGQQVSWTTRSLSDGGQRYVSAAIDQESVPHKNVLYGADYCRHAAIVVEGPTDVWRFGPGAVCTFGTTFSIAQVEQLARFPYRIICFDPEPVAQERASVLCAQLAAFDGTTYNVQLETDPGDADAKTVRKLRRKFLGE